MHPTTLPPGSLYRLVTERYPVAEALVRLSPELARWIRQMLSVEP